MKNKKIIFLILILYFCQINIAKVQATGCLPTFFKCFKCCIKVTNNLLNGEEKTKGQKEKSDLQQPISINIVNNLTENQKDKPEDEYLALVQSQEKPTLNIKRIVQTTTEDLNTGRLSTTIETVEINADDNCQNRNALRKIILSRNVSNAGSRASSIQKSKKNLETLSRNSSKSRMPCLQQIFNKEVEEELNQIIINQKIVSESENNTDDFDLFKRID